MFGRNPIRKAEHDLDGSELYVEDVFYTIQGEGPFAGHPAVFIRLAGCNLACWWCDTEFESAFRRGKPRTVTDDLVAHVNQLMPGPTRARRPLVVLTGGEPMRQNIVPLVEQLNRESYLVQVETAGTTVPDGFRWSTAAVVCSPKTPKLHSSMRHATAWKYVVSHDDADPHDGLPTQSTQRPGVTALPCRPLNSAPVYVSPRDDYDAVKNQLNLRAAADIAMKHGYRLTTQLHKEIGLK